MQADLVQELENDSSDREQFEATIASTYFCQPFQLTLRSKLDTYNGGPRPNVVCIDAKPIVYGEHGRTLLKEIYEMLLTTSAIHRTA